MTLRGWRFDMTALDVAFGIEMVNGEFIGHDSRLAIPGERYPELVLRDSIIAVLVSLAALTVTAVVVTRRRPV